MVAANYTIRCQVFTVPVRPYSRRSSSRPSELMRRTDPMIAKLVHKLQEEIQAERRLQNRNQPLDRHRQLSLLAQDLIDFEVATPPLNVEEEKGRKKVSFDAKHAEFPRNRWEKD